MKVINSALMCFILIGSLSSCENPPDIEPRDFVTVGFFQLTGNNWLSMSQADRQRVSERWMAVHEQSFARDIDAHTKLYLKHFEEAQLSLNNPDLCGATSTTDCSYMQSFLERYFTKYCSDPLDEPCTASSIADDVRQDYIDRRSEGLDVLLCAGQMHVMDEAAREAGSQFFAKRALWKCGYYDPRNKAL